MIDDKKIEEAARYYCNNRYPASQDAPFIAEGFRHGAKWAINEFLKDLWHPASEEPDVRNKTIICLYDDGSICQDYKVYDVATEYDRHNLRMGEFDWDYYALLEKIKKWCYSDDLLPKKGGKE